MPDGVKNTISRLAFIIKAGIGSSAEGVFIQFKMFLVIHKKYLWAAFSFRPPLYLRQDMLTQFKQINNERECNEGGIHNAGFIVSSKNSAKPFEPSKQAFHFDARDYQVKAKPLSFGRLAGEWLELKASQIKRSSLWSIQSGITRARDVWGQVDIKNIQYPQIEDLIKSYPGTPKTRANILAVLKHLFAWAHERCDIP